MLQNRQHYISVRLFRAVCRSTVEIPVIFEGHVYGTAEMGRSVARFIYQVSEKVGKTIDEGKFKPLERFDILETDSLGDPSKIVITALEIVPSNT